MSLVTDIQLSHTIADKESSLSAKNYLKHVVINSDPIPRRFKDLAESWQWARADYILPALESVTGHNPDYIGPKNIWETMPRGHDKTSFIGRMMNWVLCYSKRKNLRCVVAAKDGDQANLLKDFMKMEANLNPWFGNRLTFHQQLVTGPCGQLRVAAADALGLFGHNLDLFVLEELTHWEDVLGQKVWTAIWSGRRKRKSSVYLVLSNAGYTETWQHKIFLQAQEDIDWKIFEAPGILASWMDAKAIAKDRKMLPPSEAERLLDNKWVNASASNQYLTTLEIEAVEVESNRRGLMWSSNLDPNKEYVMSLDYGPKKDRTAICLGHQEGTGDVFVDRFWVWRGKDYPSGEVPIASIRTLIEDQRSEASRIWLVLDPYQLKELSQFYRSRLPVEEFEARGGKANYELAECLRTQIVNKRLLWPQGIADITLDPEAELREIEALEGIGGPPQAFPMDTLAQELTRLVLKPRIYGYRFDHTSGRHDDRACALGMMCVCIFNRPRPQQWIQGPRDVIENKKTPDPYRTRGSQVGRKMWGARF